VISVVQRVSSASVDVAVKDVQSAIGRGLLVLISIEPRDTADDVAWMANKLANLRIFPDEQGLMNESVADVDGSVLLISQFTLSGNCTKGHRPSFISAAPPEQAEPLYESLATAIRGHGLPVETGVFGAAMKVQSTNEGPVTLIIHTPER
jgi:D-tyrosyl-tRNA(Tyr) deacylase